MCAQVNRACDQHDFFMYSSVFKLIDIICIQLSVYYHDINICQRCFLMYKLLFLICLCPFSPEQLQSRLGEEGGGLFQRETETKRRSHLGSCLIMVNCLYMILTWTTIFVLYPEVVDKCAHVYSRGLFWQITSGSSSYLTWATFYKHWKPDWIIIKSQLWIWMLTAHIKTFFCLLM